MAAGDGTTGTDPDGDGATTNGTARIGTDITTTIMFTAEVVADLITITDYATIWDVQHTLQVHAQPAQPLATTPREPDSQQPAHGITTTIQPSATAATLETRTQAEFARLRFATTQET